MSMVLRTNMNSMNANRNLSINNNQVAKAIEKIASGYQINRAADDASGLAISEKMAAQITGLDQGTENALDGIGLVQTAEGAMEEIHNMLNRIVELSTKSANGTIQDEVDREAIQAEVDVLVDEIDRIAQATNFNGIQLLDGSLSDGGLVIRTTNTTEEVTNTEIVPGEVIPGVPGENDIVTETTDGITFKKVDVIENSGGYVIEVDFNDLTGSDLVGGTMTVDGIFVIEFKEATLVDGDGKLITGFLDDDGNEIDDNFTTYDSPVIMYVDPDVVVKDTVEHFHVETFDEDDNYLNIYCFGPDGYVGLSNNGYETILLESPESVVFDLPNNTYNGVTSEPTVTTPDTVLPDTTVTTTTTAVITETEVYNGDGLILHVADQNNPYNKIEVYIDPMTGEALKIKPLYVDTQELAGAAINIVKDAINYVSKNRGDLGALQNRLERTINNNNNTSENMTAAKSAIKDTDMAKQMMEYTKMDVLTQASQSMLAQSNQAPQQVLSLLG